MIKKWGKIIACIVCISMLLTSAVFALSYKDVNDWSTVAVDRVSSCGLMVGVGDGYFAPHDTITQKEVASVLFRLAKKPNRYIKPDYEFADAPADDSWYYDAILWAGYHGIVNAANQDEALYLQPDREVLRLEAAGTLYNLALYFDWIEPYTGEWKDNTELDAAGEDLKQVAAWALENNIWYGHDDGTFMPFETITRAEFAAMVSRFMDRFEAELSHPHGVYTSTLYIAATGDYTITNAEGETLIRKDGKLSGTMKYADQYLVDGGACEDIFFVKPSEYFTCTAGGEIESFSVQSKDQFLGSIQGLAGVKEAVLKNDGRIMIKGENMEYEVFHSFVAQDGCVGYIINVYMSGEGESEASFSHEKETNLYYAECDTGNFSISVTDYDELDRKDFVGQTEEVRVSVSNNGTITVESADGEEAA
ncbi:MAG: S-layer homology domain-containing protein [Clostridiales bacterium]|nr:S-layer homology domain-containing protein [Clostridiales bacterium]